MVLLVVTGSESVLHPLNGLQRRKPEVSVDLRVRSEVSLLLPFELAVAVAIHPMGTRNVFLLLKTLLGPLALTTSL